MLPTSQMRFHIRYTLHCVYYISLHTLPNGDILLVKARSLGVRNDDSSLILFWDDDNDGVADGQQILVGPEYGLTHGIEYIAPENNVRGPEGMGLLLASSDRTVYAWPYTHGDRTRSLLGTGAALVHSMNAQAASDDLGAFMGHWTRTLAVSPGDQRYLHISVGSLGNVDIDSYRSRIRRVDLTSDEESFDFREAEIFADGLRNEVGLDFDAKGILWGVENGADDLERDDIGGIITEDNPAEELNKFDGPIGTFYGYPYCWTEYDLPVYGLGTGTQWAWPSVDEYGEGWGKDDEWCRTMSRGPEVSMQGHSAPLGMTFFHHSKYDPEKCAGKGTFPPDADGDAFIGFHGSWNRDVPTGYKVVRVPFDGPGGSPSGEVIDILSHAGDGAEWPSGVRPVDVQFDQCGRLLVSDDGTQSIFTITYDGDSFPAIDDMSKTFVKKKQKNKSCAWLAAKDPKTVKKICRTRTLEPKAEDSCPWTCNFRCNPNDPSNPPHLACTDESTNRFLHRKQRIKTCKWLSLKPDADRTKLCKAKAKKACPAVCDGFSQ